MEQSEDIKEAKDILQNIIKAKKAFRMYPQNNPIYIKTLEEIHERFKNYFSYKDEYKLHIKHNTILYDSQEIYNNPEKEDNLALFFFKDGLRELKFTKGLSKDELEEFLKILALDFDREVIDDDVVTLLWEKDFQNIQYVVDEAVLVDIEEEDYETRAEEEVMEEPTDEDQLLKAYREGFSKEDVKGVPIMPITEEDLRMLARELERDSYEKIGKLSSILFEIIYQSEEKREIEEVFKLLKETIKFSVRYRRLDIAVNIMKRANAIIKDQLINDNIKRYMRMLLFYFGTEEIISMLSDFLDKGIEADDKIFKGFVELLDKNAIPPFVKLLGDLKTIHARKSVIEALIFLGKKDLQTLSKGLDDEKWFVVRNIIYILRKIGDKRAIEYLLRTVNHKDIRVRKEVIRALGELGGKEVVLTLKECLDDSNSEVRIASAKAFGRIGSETAKRIILDKISNKEFMERDFDEKREYYEVLSKWKDREVIDFLIKVLKKKRFFFGRAKNFENRACAAFCLGLIGDKEVLPVLYKYKNSNNRILKEHLYTAIKRIENGR